MWLVHFLWSFWQDWPLLSFAVCAAGCFALYECILLVSAMLRKTFRPFGHTSVFIANTGRERTDFPSMTKNNGSDLWPNG